MRRFALTALVIAITALTATTALAVDPMASDKPISVNADSLEVDNKANIAHFVGNVDAVQGDVKIKCDQLDVHYSNQGKKDKEEAGMMAGGGGRVTKVVALGHVKITQKDRVAMGRKGTYWAGGRKLLMEGKATVWQGKNQVAGDKITVYLDKDRAVVHGKPGKRVSVTIVPKKNQ